MSNEVLAPDDVRLTEFAGRANNEHRLALAAGQSMVEHAISAGEALEAARALIPYGGWMNWLAANFEGSKRALGRALDDLYVVEDSICRALAVSRPDKKTDMFAVAYLASTKPRAR
jgi:hypothetical protein